MNNQLKKVSYIVSLTCAVHCLITPVLILMLPFLGHHLSNIYIEAGLLGFSILAGLWIVYRGYCSHKQSHSLLVFTIGALFWIFHLVFESLGIHHNEFFLVISGAILVIISYILNHRSTTCCCTTDHEHH